MNDRVRIKDGWESAGREGALITYAISINGTRWTGVQWDDEEDPDWHKTDGLEIATTEWKSFDGS
jgi:hypothetical protein